MDTKLYYSIGEVAEILGENTSLVRFWTNSFAKYIRPKRNLKGNRIYTKDEGDFLRQLHYLIKDKGLTLEGAAKQLASDKKKVEATVQILDTLKGIRQLLANIRNSL